MIFDAYDPAGMLVIDAETRSPQDLAYGSYRYFENLNTEVSVISYGFIHGRDDTGSSTEIKHFCPLLGEPLPQDFLDHVLAGRVLIAHNASFERTLWRVLQRYYPELITPKIHQWRCTSVMASSAALPRALGDVGRVLNTMYSDANIEQKSKDGQRLMMRLCKHHALTSLTGKLVSRFPAENNQDNAYEQFDTYDRWSAIKYSPFPLQYNDGTPIYAEYFMSEREFYAQVEYCNQDIRAEIDVFHLLPKFTRARHVSYWFDQTLNQRGLPIDTDLLDRARLIQRTEACRLDDEMSALTDDAVTTTDSLPALKRWFMHHGFHDLDNEDRPTPVAVNKTTLSEISKRLESFGNPKLIQAFHLRLCGAQAAVKKLDTMVNSISSDGRIRGTREEHGARTGRPTGRLVQMYNLKRNEQDVDTLAEDILAGHDAMLAKYGDDTMSVLGEAVRPMIKAPEGKTLVVFDLAQIEARVNAWAAGQDDLVEAFANDEPIYEKMASQIYGVPVDRVNKDQRFVGKSTALGAGYGMGSPKFQTTCAKFGVDLSTELCKTAIETYRIVNDKIVASWRKQEHAAVKAINHRGELYKAGIIKYKSTGDFLHMILPSGRVLRYAQPYTKSTDREWINEDGEPVLLTNPNAIFFRGVSNSHPIKDDDQISFRQWRVIPTYGAKLVENLCQAIAFDILSSFFAPLKKLGTELILDCYDEVVLLVDEDRVTPEFMKQVETVMTTPPKWAIGLPLAAEGWTSKRYRKG